MRVIRADATRWQIDPQRVGVMGFSAGGHVAARLSNGFDAPVYPHRDAIDALSARPDVALLIYPVIDMGAHAHTGSRARLLGPHPDAALQARFSMQEQVRTDTPPTFLVHAQDDKVVSVDNSLVYYQALRRAGVATEMHLFPFGGHGFGVRIPAGLTAAQWPELALRWIPSRHTEPPPIFNGVVSCATVRATHSCSVLPACRCCRPLPGCPARATMPRRWRVYAAGACAGSSSRA